METIASNDQETLQAQLRQSRERLDGLVRNLQAIDCELEELSAERQQHQLLIDVCGGLEKLSALGAGGLFWDGWPGQGQGQEHLQLVRVRVDEFGQRLGAIEKSRQQAIDEIQEAEDATDLLEDDFFELKKEEELRKREWVLERESASLPLRETIMPWSRGGEDDQLFRKSLVVSLLVSLLLGLILPQINLPVPERWEVIEIPDRFTRLLEEQKPEPVKPAVAQDALPEELKEETSEEEAAQVAEESTPKAAPGEGSQKSVESTGILAFRGQFSGLVDRDPASRLGAQATIDRSGEMASGRSERSMVTTQAPGSSGGINVGALSRGLGGSGGEGIQGVQVTRATSSIGGVGGSDRPLSGGGPGLGRTDEEIQIVFDRHKAALYRLYNRELRRNPTLKGQMVLRLTIETDGSVSLCELKSSDMDAPKLSAQIVSRVKTFDFGAKEGVPAITILYPIDFLPAT